MIFENRSHASEVWLRVKDPSNTTVGLPSRATEALTLPFELLELFPWETSLLQNNPHSLELASLPVSIREVERLGSPICKGAGRHWNRFRDPLPTRIKNLFAIVVETRDFDEPILSRGRRIDWHIAGRYFIASTLDMCRRIVENKDVVVVGIMLLDDVHSPGDLVDYVVMKKIPVTTCAWPKDDTG